MMVSKNTNNVINFLIVKGGLAPSGTPISIRVDNAVSRAKNGFKPYILVSESKFALNLIDRDMKSIGNDIDTYPSSFPFTTTWISSVDGVNPTATTDFPVTCNSKSEYQTTIVRETKSQLKQEGERFLAERGDGKLSVTLEFQPGKGWNIGDIINSTIAEIGKVNNPMRVSERELTVTSE